MLFIDRVITVQFLKKRWSKQDRNHVVFLPATATYTYYRCNNIIYTSRLTFVSTLYVTIIGYMWEPIVSPHSFAISYTHLAIRDVTDMRCVMS